MDENNLDLKPQQTELDERFVNFFTYYKSFRVDRADFERGNRIGEGMSCNVYKGNMKSTNQEVAIKEYKLDFLGNINSERLLRREIDFLSQLVNEYLVEFIGFNDDPGETLWFITKYIKNPNLDYTIHERKGFLCPEAKLKIAFEIAQGMEYLQYKKVIHRDLKPSNILLVGKYSFGSRELTPKICDFGLARTDTSVSKTNGIGTLLYMAPEVLNGGDYTLKAGVYSFGNILFELISSQKPFFWVKSKEELYKSISKPLAYDKLKNIYISDELKKLIEDARSCELNVRPSFTEIINRMIGENITFPGLNKEIAKKFYEKKSEERKIMNYDTTD